MLPDIYSGGNANFLLGLTPIVNPAPAPLTVGADVDGIVAAPGVTNTYTFTLTAATTLLLTSFSFGQATFTLSGPNGTIVSQDLAGLAYGNYSGLYGRAPLITLAAGTYTIAITDYDQNNPVSYAFRLQDFASATQLTLGQTTNATLAYKTDVGLFSVALTAGNQLRIQEPADYYGGEALVVLDPQGMLLTGTSTGQGTVYQTTTSGTYLILVEGHLDYGDVPTNGTVPYSVTAYQDPPPAPLALGTIASGTLADANSIARYTIDVTTPTQAVFDTLTPNGNVVYVLTGPDGFYSAANFGYSDGFSAQGDPVLFLSSGAYMLTITTSSASLYAFQFLNVDSSTPLTSGNTVSASLSPGNSTTLYAVAATAGVRFNISTTDPNNAIDIRVLDPFGNEVISPQHAGQQLVTPSASGTYTVEVEGQVNDGGGPNPYTITLLPVVQTTAALAGLSSTTGPFTMPGAVGTALGFTGQDTITVPNGAAIPPASGPFTIEAWINPDEITAGNVALITDGSQATTPQYALYLTNGDQIHFSISDGTNNYNLYTNYGIAPGGVWTQVTATLDPSTNLMTIYINGVQAAQQSYGAFSPQPNSQPLYIAPQPPDSDVNIAAYEGGLDEISLWNVALTGAQIAAQMGAPLQGNEAGLTLYLPLNDPSGSATVADLGPNHVAATVSHAFDGLPDVIEGRIGSAFEIDTYTFTVAQATNFVIDSLGDNGAFTLTLTGPDGFSYSRQIISTDSGQQGGDPFLVMPAGNYTLTISAGTNPAVGGYALRFIDLSTAAPIALNTPVTVNLPAGTYTQAFTFQASAGTQLLFDALQDPTSSYETTIRILDPNGQQIYSPNNFQTQTNIPTLSLSGTYTILIEGEYYQRTGPLQLSFALDTYITSVAAVTIGGANPTPGPVWGGAPGGTGITLTGADEVDVTSGPATDLTGSLTIEATVRFDGFYNQYTPIATQVDSTGTRAFGLYVGNDGSIVGVEQDANGEQGVGTRGGLVTPGTFYTFAMVVDRTFGTLTLYLNGQQVATTNIRADAGITVNAPLVLGATHESGNNYSRLTGAMGTVRVWSVALSAAQILSNISTTPAANASGLVLDLPFTDGSGTTAINIAPPGGTATLVGLNPDGITGDLSRPGESNAYTFTVSQTTQIIVDSLSGNSQLQWIITSAYGTVAGNLFTQTNGFDNGSSRVITLPPGSYTFTISGTNAGYGYYNIRLVDIHAQATPLTLGTPVSGTLDPQDRDQVYSFTANANDTLFFDVASAAGDFSWRLIDPSGNQLGGPRGFNTTSVVLPYAGTWTILIEGQASESSIGSYNFTPIISPTITTALTLGTAVNGTITTPSETDAYTFGLSAPGQVVFDSLTASNQFSWTLTGPGGTVVNARGFANSDAGGIGGDTVLDLPAGNYTLSVVSSGATTGAYGFQLLNVTAGTAIATNTPVTGSLADGGAATDIYLFTATAREQVDFEPGASSSNSTVWRLIDPNGNVVFGPNNFTDSGMLTLQAGTYILLIEGAPGQTGGATYGFTIASVAQQQANGQTTQDFDTANLLPYTAANYGGPASAVVPGSTGNALQLTQANQSYQSNAIYFPVTTDGALQQLTVDFDLTVTPASGQDSSVMLGLIDAGTYGNSGAGPDLFNGNWTGNGLGISFDTNDDRGGDGSNNHISLYSDRTFLTEQFVSPADADLSAGTPVHATVTVAQADGGVLVTVVLTPQGGTAFTALSGYFVAGYELQNLRVAFEGENRGDTATQTIDNVAIAATPGPSPEQPITLGQPVSGSVTVPGGIERYGLDVTTTTTVVFDDLTTDPNNTNLTITGPGGTLFSNNLNSSDSYYDGGDNELTLTPGHYTFSISRSDNGTGAFSFQVLDTSTATPITIGTLADAPVNVTLNPGDSTALFTFAGTAGQVIAFQNVGGSPYAFIRIVGPDGQLITQQQNISNFGPITLGTTGTYLFEVEGYSGAGTAAAQLSFQLIDASAQTAPLVLGEGLHRQRRRA